MPRAPDTAFNVWLGVVDELLTKSVPLQRAMYLAGTKLQQMQKEYKDTLFDPADLNYALFSVNTLLKTSTNTANIANRYT